MYVKKLQYICIRKGNKRGARQKDTDKMAVPFSSLTVGIILIGSK